MPYDLPALQLLSHDDESRLTLEEFQHWIQSTPGMVTTGGEDHGFDTRIASLFMLVDVDHEGVVSQQRCQLFLKEAIRVIVHTLTCVILTAIESQPDGEGLSEAILDGMAESASTEEGVVSVAGILGLVSESIRRVRERGGCKPLLHERQRMDPNRRAQVGWAWIMLPL